MQPLSSLRSSHAERIGQQAGGFQGETECPPDWCLLHQRGQYGVVKVHGGPGFPAGHGTAGHVFDGRFCVWTQYSTPYFLDS